MANNEIIEIDNDFESIKSKKLLGFISQNILNTVKNLDLTEKEKRILLKDIVLLDNGEREEWLADFIDSIKKEK
ncbi:MAG: hypothetical protein HWN67_09980 [Candidatus Helarchaeota archaeon]|nr:hypothetical protein [Candidatus Helarchaeota archaeon]